MSKYISHLTIHVEHGENNDVEEVELTANIDEDFCIEHIYWDKSMYGRYENGEIDDWIEKHKHHIVNRLIDKVKERFIPTY